MAFAHIACPDQADADRLQGRFLSFSSSSARRDRDCVDA
jgi:hypothetical protein